jgi:type I restriction enzyme S subunit
LKYVLLAETEALLRFASGTTHQTIYYPEAKAFHVCLPPIDTQGAIVDVLGALDDKIELNRRTARALEQFARTIYRAWFVEFEPVKAKIAGARSFPSMCQQIFDALPARLVDSHIGPVPEGWDVVRLGEVLTLQRGFDLPKQSRRDGPHPIFAASGMNGFHSEWKVKGPGVTTGRSGVLGQVFYVDSDFWPLNTSLWVKEYTRSNPWHAYFLLQTLNLAQFNAGSAVPTLNRNHVHSLPIVAAPNRLLAKFAQICDPMFAVLKQLRSESEKLTEMREYLLPRLLSGKVLVGVANG